MRYKEYNQEQPWLIPPNIEDEIPANDSCRVINDLIDTLDISEIEADYHEEGKPAYHPRMMLKILFYSYSQKIFSSRRISNELQRNIYYWYLSGKQRPDFRTIALFRLRHIERLKPIFIQIVHICMKLGLADLSLVAIDGTKIKANASKEKFRDKEWLDNNIAEEIKKIEEILKEEERIDKDEDEAYGADKRGDEIPEGLMDRKTRLERIKKLKEELDQKKCNRINETDTDAKIMKSKGKYLSAYNCQAIVEEKNQIIIMADVVDQENDWNQVKIQVGEIQKAYDMKPATLLGDTGYFDSVNLNYLQDEGIEGIIPDKPMKEIHAELNGAVAANKKFKKDRFNYDKRLDAYRCPEGHELNKTTAKPLIAIRKNAPDIQYYQYRSKSCNQCRHKTLCCRSNSNRMIIRYVDEELREQMAARIRSTHGYYMYKKRMKIIEPVFGNIKLNHGFSAFNLRGMLKTRGEFLIMAAVHNIKKVKKHLEMQGTGNLKVVLAVK